MMVLSFSTSSVSYAASLSVCGESKTPSTQAGSTPYDNYDAYSKWLIAEKGKNLSDDQFAKEDAAYKTANNICQASDIFRQVARIINYLIGFIGVFVVVRVVISGFQMVMSQGNAENLKVAKDGIRNSIIGLVLVLGAFVLANIIFQLAGVGGFNLNPYQ